MPELPDVEEFRRHLDATSLHKRIDDVEVRSARVIAGMSGAELARRVAGDRFTATRRHGKHLLVDLDDDAGCLAMHFGMTGALRHVEADEEPPDLTRVLFRFAGGEALCYVSRRMLGRITVTADCDAYLHRHELGPDALALDARGFLERVEGRRARLKAVLMDQSLVAGIGNVYADEILFQAGHHPETPLDRLSPDELRRLHRTIRQVLEDAIERRADPRRIPRTWLLHDRRDGRACPRCDGTIRRLRIGGRSSYVCDRHQERRTARAA